MITTRALIEELKRRNAWVGAAELAETFGITARTVRNYVKRVNDEAGREVITSSHMGYRIDPTVNQSSIGPISKVENVSSEKVLHATVDGPDARVFQLLAWLLQASSPLDIYELADDLCVADSTVMGDLRRVQQTASRFDLALVHTRGHISLEGRELDKRRLIGNLIAGSNSEALTDLSDWPFLESGYDRRRLAGIVSDELTNEGIAFNDYGLNNIVLHLAVMLDRVRHGRTVPETVDTSLLQNEPSWRAALASVRRAVEPFSVSIPNSELYYFALMISSSVRGIGGTIGDIENLIDANDLSVARRAVEELEEAYGLEPFDESFVERLAIHLHALAVRVRSGSYARNPLRSKTKAA